MTRWTMHVAPDAPTQALVLRGLLQGLLAGVIFGVVMGVSKDASHGLFEGVVFGVLMAAFAVTYNLVLRNRARVRTGPR